MSDDRPPVVVGFEIKPFVIVNPDRRDFHCGIHRGAVEFPTTAEPIWRGEVPEGASCRTCGIDLTEL